MSSQEHRGAAKKKNATGSSVLLAAQGSTQTCSSVLLAAQGGPKTADEKKTRSAGQVPGDGPPSLVDRRRI